MATPKTTANRSLGRLRRLAPWLLLCLLFPATSWAQRSGRVSLTGDVGAVWPLFHHENNRRFLTTADVIGGASINYGISDHAGVEFGLLIADQNVKINRDKSTKMTLQELNIQFRWNILTDYIQPYLTLGADYTIISLDPPLNDESDPGLNGGLGLEMLLTDHIAVGIVGRYTHMFAKQFDSARMVNAMATVAYTF